MSRSQVLPRPRGVALVTVLWVSALLAALCTAFLLLVLTQQRFQGQESDKTRAVYVARSGIEYLAGHGGLETLEKQPDGTWRLPIDSTSECRFIRDDTTHVITCRGVVTNGHGRVFASHDLVVPPDNVDAFANNRSAVAEVRK